MNVFENKKVSLEAPGIDPGTSRMLSERSTIWATPPIDVNRVYYLLYKDYKQYDSNT